MATHLCSVCSLPTEKFCKNCKEEYYCGQKCQSVSWKGGHNKTCNKAPITHYKSKSTANKVASILASIDINVQYSSQRTWFCRTFARAIPSQEVIDKLSAMLEGKGQILSVAGGRGLWEFLLKENGIKITVTDAFKSHGIEINNKTFTTVKRMDHLTAIASFPEATTLFICWPSFNDPFAFEYLERLAGNLLIYVGEEKYGCTVDDSLFNLLDEKWTQTTQIDIPNWHDIYDAVFIYERK